MRHTKRISLWMVITVIALLVMAVSALAAEPVITEKMAADVNGATITMLALNNEYRQVLKQQGIAEADVSEEKSAEFKKEILDSLINQELLYQEAQKNNVPIDEERVKESIAKVRGNFETEEAYQSALKDANMQESDLTAKIRRALAINQLVDDKVSQHVTVTDEESKAYYDAHPDSFQRTEEVRASHILVKVDKDADEAQKAAARKKIEEIQQKINAGGDFAELAKEYSDCPSSANGGDLGYFERGKMVQPFEDAAFALSPGSVSDIVETQYGYHLIKVTDKIEAGTVDYETVKSDLQDYLKRQKISAGVTSLLETLRKESMIKTYL